jgi:peptide/nickel transport system permease protein
MKVKRPPLSKWGKAGLVILAIHALIAIVGPFFAPTDPGEILSFIAFAPPGEEGTVLGTDYLGRDLLSRLLYGAGLTISLAIATTAVGFVGGVLVGFYAAEAGGRIDTLIFRVVDVVISFPPILLALVIIVGLGSSISVLIFSVGIIQLPRVARIARAVAMDIGTRDFVEAARARGETIWSILVREILPNSLMPLAAEFGLRLAYAVLLLAALSFLGLGIQPPLADWGALVRENMAGLYYGGWSIILPALSIATLVVGINLLVDSLLAQANRDVSREMLQ